MFSEVLGFPYGLILVLNLLVLFSENGIGSIKRGGTLSRLVFVLSDQKQEQL